ncbi:FAD-binding oxidoreductase [Brucella sp. NM4]|uniref:NAD(P)/FAD-dependent oxidoreductase n=1 Tax=Brucella/Ochrobactrum group TaxID=2826938 RepID=UPI0024BCDF47|nr:FAD-binding oxidoreductase [Brucella sp. NM4]WHS29871.1 FAD-binding oxidoreductase [Brucella sp. NM4]WHT44643.1 FAD-binding oxidoreductase [Ochrobactrum sp. SSR]
MSDISDILIIGGGVIGSAIAYFLTRDATHPIRVTVIERDPSYASASSSLSASAIRQQFTAPENIALSQYGIGFIRDTIRHLSVENYPADIGFLERGYLYLGGEKDVPAFQSRANTLRDCGYQVELLDTKALKARAPWMNTEDVSIASFGPYDEGWFDGPALHQAFRRKARVQGVEYITGEVLGFTREGSDKITSVRLRDGRSFQAGRFVVAAGAWTGALMRNAGVEVPIVPRKRCIFVFDSPEKIADCPFVIDQSGSWFRPEGHLYICGTTPDFENAPDDYSLDVDYAIFDERIWPKLAHRIPGFEQLRLLRAWAGLYEYNLFDQCPVIGPVSENENLFIVAGFSGHGMMHAPATGLAVSEMLLHGKTFSINVSAFNFDRIQALRPIPERVYYWKQNEFAAE